MLDYNILDRERKVTLQRFDFGPSLGEWGGENIVCIGEKNPYRPLFSFSFSLSFVPDFDLPGGLTGRWKRLYRNNKPREETMGETQRRQRKRRRIRGDLRSAHGPVHVSIGPADRRPCSFHHLDGSDLHHSTGKEIRNISSSKICDCFPRDL